MPLSPQKRKAASGDDNGDSENDDSYDSGSEDDFDMDSEDGEDAAAADVAPAGFEAVYKDVRSSFRCVLGLRRCFLTVVRL